MDNDFEKIKKIVADILQVDEKAVTIETSLTDLGADSLDTVELLMEIEDHFEIEIPNEDAEKLVTIENAVDYIAEQKNENKIYRSIPVVL